MTGDCVQCLDDPPRAPKTGFMTLPVWPHYLCACDTDFRLFPFEAVFQKFSSFHWLHQIITYDLRDANVGGSLITCGFYTWLSMYFNFRASLSIKNSSLMSHVTHKRITEMDGWPSHSYRALWSPSSVPCDLLRAQTGSLMWSQRALNSIPAHKRFYQISTDRVTWTEEVKSSDRPTPLSACYFHSSGFHWVCVMHDH